MDKVALEKNIIHFIADKLNVDIATLSLNTHFTSNLGLSSFKVMELICDIEDEFNTDIDSEDIVKLQTIGKLIKYIESKK